MSDIGPVRACECAERERAENRASGSGELGEWTFQKTLERQRSVEAAERERSGKRAKSAAQSPMKSNISLI